MPEEEGDVLMKRARMLVLVAFLAGLCGAGALAAGHVSGPPLLSELGPWATAGARVAFYGTINNRQGLWVDAFGSNQPRWLVTAGCGEGSEPSELAAGPNGSWACLTAIVSNSDAFYAVDLVLANGSVRHVATAGGPTGQNGTAAQRQSVDSIPQLFGDGNFLGYLHVTPTGVVQLYQITATGHGKRLANLVGVSGVPTATTQTPTPAVAVANSTVAILRVNGSVAVFATTGAPLAMIPAQAASIALISNRVVVRTVTRRLVVYGLHGGLVHSWPLGATSFTNGLAAYDGYAVYIGANKAVRAVKLTTGTDRIIARAGTGWFWGGASLQSPGVVAPLTSQHGQHAFPVTLRFIPMAALHKAVG
jgi:hypothetical protein